MKTLGQCSCINQEYARTIEGIIERARVVAKSFVEAPYGAKPEVVAYFKKELVELDDLEDAIKSLDLCDVKPPERKR